MLPVSFRSRRTARWAVQLGFLLSLLGGFVAGCAYPGAAPDSSSVRALEGLAGNRIVYRFPNGRTYRADYGTDTIHFVLLEPLASPPPEKTMPYRARVLRKELFLVVWDDDEFFTTFVVDLAERRLHASADRGEGGRFLGEAQILEVVPLDD